MRFESLHSVFTQLHSIALRCAPLHSRLKEIGIRDLRKNWHNKATFFFFFASNRIKDQTTFFRPSKRIRIIVFPSSENCSRRRRLRRPRRRRHDTRFCYTPSRSTTLHSVSPSVSRCSAFFRSYTDIGRIEEKKV